MKADRNGSQEIGIPISMAFVGVQTECHSSILEQNKFHYRCKQINLTTPKIRHISKCSFFCSDEIQWL